MERTLSVLGAVQVIQDLSEKPVAPPPAVEATLAHALQNDDPILDSLRVDYAPEFDSWLTRCKLEHRLAWTIREPSEANLAAFCIVKNEESPPQGLSGKVLKFCTFKVSEQHLGYRYGELLLKTVFEHAFENRHDWAFVTVFEKHAELVCLLEGFGFRRLVQKTKIGELILAKPFSETVEPATDLDDISYHIRFGPRRLRFNPDKTFLVPIQPRLRGSPFP